MCRESLTDIPDLWRCVYDLIAQVPEGKVATFGAIAKSLGDVVASRFVGVAVSRGSIGDEIPLHRVVRSDGRLDGASKESIRALKAEGVRIHGGKVDDLAVASFMDFKTDHPLRELRARQLSLRNKMVIPSDDLDVDSVAGVDIAYHGEHAFASLVIMDRTSVSVCETRTIEGVAVFPYIPSYLAFRELPLIMPFTDMLDERTVLIYDGNGTLHPETFGIACHAGLVMDVPTVGVAKKLLCGTPFGRRSRGARKICLDGHMLGYEYLGGRTGRPIYISAGNGISQAQSLRITVDMTIHRLPEPTRLAHNLAVDMRRAKTHK